MRKLVPVTLTLLLAASFGAAAQVTKGGLEIKDEFGRQTLAIPGATERGDWTGTWYYISREVQVALWLNDKGEGLPEIKMRLFRLGGGEQFVTDWNGHAEYNVRGAPAQFDLTLEDGDANALDGVWDWSLEFASSSRKERAKIKAYRSGDGRRLVLRFDEFVRTIRRGQIVNELPLDQAWVFRKASKRIVDWTELPF